MTLPPVGLVEFDVPCTDSETRFVYSSYPDLLRIMHKWLSSEQISFMLWKEFARKTCKCTKSRECTQCRDVAYFEEVDSIFDGAEAVITAPGLDGECIEMRIPEMYQQAYAQVFGHRRVVKYRRRSEEGEMFDGVFR